MVALPILSFVAGAGLTGLFFVQRAAARRRAETRANYFATISSLFDETRSRIEPSGFARMTARLGADSFDLQALPDSLSMRKLPALWVMVTFPQPQNVQATLDIMIRPGGLETFSHFHQLRQSLPVLAGLPEGAVIRSDDATRVPEAARIERHLGLFADPRIKELLISPKGLRIVFLAEEASRSRYLLFRDAELGLQPLAPERLRPVIDTLLALRDSLKGAP